MKAEMVKLNLSTQMRLLNRCIEYEYNLSEELDRLGYSYDMLRYRVEGEYVASRTKFRAIDDYDYQWNGIPTVSFFSGAGGFDIGFEAAGFSHVAAIENNAIFCETLRMNRPKWRVYGPPGVSGDLRDRELIGFLLYAECNIQAPFDGVFHGGPPCQPFSIAANQRFAKSGNDFKRVGFSHDEYGTLLFDYVWYILEFQPRAFIIENVPGLLTIDGGKQLRLALDLLGKAGYQTAPPTILNAANFGVPQERKRLFVIGWRGRGDYLYPAPEHIQVPCYKALNHNLCNAPNHITRAHTAESVIRYINLGFGKRDQLGRVDRLNPNIPSKTVIAGGTKGGGRSHLHPMIPRTLSAREAARLQTFPDSYVFAGPPARQFTQVGNAVPPSLAMKIALSIKDSFFR